MNKQEITAKTKVESSDDILVNSPDVKIQWRVLYEDQTTLDQNYKKENEHHFGHIDQEKLVAFILINNDDMPILSVDVRNGEILVYNLHLKVSFPKGEKESDFKLIYFRRIRQVFEHTGTVIVVKHAVGLQKNIDGKNYQQIIMVDDELLQQK